MRRVLFITIVPLIIFPSVSRAQSKYGTTDEEIQNCKQNLTLYREYADQQIYSQAYQYWKKVDEKCPNAANSHYPYGRVIIFELLNEPQTKKQRKELLNDLRKLYEDWIKVAEKPEEIEELKGSDLDEIRK